MAIAEIIKYEGDNKTFVWKHPSEEFNSLTQLIVHESQEAIFMMNGQALDLFGPGRYTLETQNIPALGKYLNRTTGDKTPFHCEVYFINKTEQMSIKWGTDTKVQYIEPTYEFPISLGASGEMSLRAENSKRLLLKLVGTERMLTQEKLTSVFRAFLMTKVKTYIAQIIKERAINIFEIDENLLNDIVTTNHDLPEDAKRDLIVALIVLKYTQSNSVCYAKDGQAIGIGAGQQSRIHCTRLAGQKADNWLLRQHPRVLALPFVEKIARADRDNTIDVFISDEPDEVLADGRWQRFFTERPEPLTKEEKRAWLNQQTGVALGSDAFFPFGDNIERAHRSGVTYVAQPGGSIRDDNVIDACNLYNMVMCFTHMRLFHH